MATAPATQALGPRPPLAPRPRGPLAIDRAYAARVPASTAGSGVAQGVTAYPATARAVVATTAPRRRLSAGASLNPRDPVSFRDLLRELAPRVHEPVGGDDDAALTADMRRLAKTIDLDDDDLDTDTDLDNDREVLPGPHARSGSRNGEKSTKEQRRVPRHSREGTAETPAAREAGPAGQRTHGESATPDGRTDGDASHAAAAPGEGGAGAKSARTSPSQRRRRPATASRASPERPGSTARTAGSGSGSAARPKSATETRSASPRPNRSQESPRERLLAPRVLKTRADEEAEQRPKLSRRERRRRWRRALKRSVALFLDAQVQEGKKEAARQARARALESLAAPAKKKVLDAEGQARLDALVEEYKTTLARRAAERARQEERMRVKSKRGFDPAYIARLAEPCGDLPLASARGRTSSPDRATRVGTSASHSPLPRSSASASSSASPPRRPASASASPSPSTRGRGGGESGSVSPRFQALFEEASKRTQSLEAKQLAVDRVRSCPLGFSRRQGGGGRGGMVSLGLERGHPFAFAFRSSFSDLSFGLPPFRAFPSLLSSRSFLPSFHRHSLLCSWFALLNTPGEPAALARPAGTSGHHARSAPGARSSPLPATLDGSPLTSGAVPAVGVRHGPCRVRQRRSDFVLLAFHAVRVVAFSASAAVAGGVGWVVVDRAATTGVSARRTRVLDATASGRRAHPTRARRGAGGRDRVRARHLRDARPALPALPAAPPTCALAPSPQHSLPLGDVKSDASAVRGLLPLRALVLCLRLRLSSIPGATYLGSQRRSSRS